VCIIYELYFSVNEDSIRGTLSGDLKGNTVAISRLYKYECYGKFNAFNIMILIRTYVFSGDFFSAAAMKLSKASL